MEPSVGIMELVLSVGKVVTSPEGGKYVTSAMCTTKYYQRRRARTYRYCHTLSARKIGYPLLAQKRKKNVIGAMRG